MKKYAVKKYLTGSFILLFIGVVFINTMVTKPTGGYLTQQSGYSPQQGFDLISAYGEAGRRLHLTVCVYDLFLIFLFALFFSLCITWLYTKLFDERIKVLRTLCFIPIFYAIVQLSEVIFACTVLLSYPERHDFLFILTNMLTSMKITLTYVCLIIVLAGFAFLFLRNLIFRLSGASRKDE